MNLFSFVKQFADRVSGQFTEYDNTKAIVVVPTFEGRFQTILLTLETGSGSGQWALLSSKVCEYTSSIDPKNLLEQNGVFSFSKFVIKDGHLKVEATCPSNVSSEEDISQMLLEVARIADQYEMKLTGKDIH